ncbi:MAG: hypothetical protein FJ312_01460 [SAR202 cluster bacterium]|nr:hypothetical protein [SAR202 cluster bacterium]
MPSRIQTGRKPAALKSRDFLAEVVELTQMQLPDGLRDVQVVGPVFSLVKLHYGDPAVHYEVWLQRRAGLVEVGLHFEGAPDANARQLAALSRHAEEIVDSLGPTVELEQWTASWTRVHEHLRMEALDEDLLLVVSQRLAAFVRVLEPMVRAGR